MISAAAREIIEKLDAALTAAKAAEERASRARAQEALRLAKQVRDELLRCGASAEESGGLDSRDPKELALRLREELRRIDTTE